jgi:hypothetical protein
VYHRLRCIVKSDRTPAGKRVLFNPQARLKANREYVITRAQFLIGSTPCGSSVGCALFLENRTTVGREYKIAGKAKHRF